MSMRAIVITVFIVVLSFFAVFEGCGTVPIKRYYVINYDPNPLRNRINAYAYPYTIRVKEFDIEQAYARPQMVYRKSPFELEYYYYQSWAVKPTRMITDVILKHLSSVNLTSHVVRRFDEGLKPDFELSGSLEAIEEYDSEKIWFAHLSLTIKLTRLSDNKNVYTRYFDHRKKVFQHTPEYVVRELSLIMDYIVTQAIMDIDRVLAVESGAASPDLIQKAGIPYDTVTPGDTLE
jgi:ABC-type uncharacterized transport system auxiliary subunit